MSLTLEWVNEQELHAISPELIERLEQLLRLAAEAEQVDAGEVALTFVDNEQIRELNLQYRGLDKPTDVLSFPMLEEDEDDIRLDELETDDGEEADFAPLLGDIVISVPRALEQSVEYGHSLEREIGFLFVHGFLHLIGYDHGDEVEEKEMFARQERILELAGLRR